MFQKNPIFLIIEIVFAIVKILSSQAMDVHPCYKLNFIGSLCVNFSYLLLSNKQKIEAVFIQKLMLNVFTPLIGVKSQNFYCRHLNRIEPANDDDDDNNNNNNNC